MNYLIYQIYNICKLTEPLTITKDWQRTDNSILPSLVFGTLTHFTENNYQAAYFIDVYH